MAGQIVSSPLVTSELANESERDEAERNYRQLMVNVNIKLARPIKLKEFSDCEHAKWQSR